MSVGYNDIESMMSVGYNDTESMMSVGYNDTESMMPEGYNGAESTLSVGCNDTESMAETESFSRKNVCQACSHTGNYTHSHLVRASLCRKAQKPKMDKS